MLKGEVIYVVGGESTYYTPPYTFSSPSLRPVRRPDDIIGLGGRAVGSHGGYGDAEGSEEVQRWELIAFILFVVRCDVETPVSCLRVDSCAAHGWFHRQMEQLHEKR